MMRAVTLAATVALLGCNAIPINIPDPKAADGGSPDLHMQGSRDTGPNQDAPENTKNDKGSPPPPIGDLEYVADGGPSVWDDSGYPDASPCFGDALCPPVSDGGSEAGPMEGGAGEGGPSEAGTELEAGQPLDSTTIPPDAKADL